ncbi:MAG: 5'/3'-nucleotidase SurE [Muribaculaceae bacterium]|nr:5'/3'-nucleotidase SurE [Muribaculaceae bacterium]
MGKPIILISNDDGIESAGIHRLVDYVKDFGEVWVVAPDKPHSGQSSAMTVNAPLRIISKPDYNSARMFAVTGTPVDCVKLAYHTILPRVPDIMLCGINHGSNAGNSIIYSGTMGAVMEATTVGVPAVGYSLLSHSPSADFSETEPFIKHITSIVLKNGLPAGICLNVNFPAKVKIEGIKVVRAATSHWTEEYQEYLDPHGKPFYWLKGKIINEEPEASDTDLYWLDRNFATIVPARVNQNAIDHIDSTSALLNMD